MSVEIDEVSVTIRFVIEDVAPYVELLDYSGTEALFRPVSAKATVYPSKREKPFVAVAVTGYRQTKAGTDYAQSNDVRYWGDQADVPEFVREIVTAVEERYARVLEIDQ